MHLACLFEIRIFFKHLFFVTEKIGISTTFLKKTSLDPSLFKVNLVLGGLELSPKFVRFQRGLLALKFFQKRDFFL